MSYKEQAIALYQMVGEGKNANCEYEKQFLGNVKEVHGGSVNEITSD